MREYVQAYPDRAAGYENLALFLVTQGRYEEALAAYDRAGSLDSRNFSSDYGHFVVHALEGQWLEAEQRFALALDACPGDPTPRHHYAQALWQRGEVVRAIEEMDTAVLLSGGDPLWTVELGQRYGLHVSLNFHRAPGYCINNPQREPFVLWSDRRAEDARGLGDRIHP